VVTNAMSAPELAISFATSVNVASSAALIAPEPS
jgi:hypothetical protein